MYRNSWDQRYYIKLGVNEVSMAEGFYTIIHCMYTCICNSLFTPIPCKPCTPLIRSSAVRWSTITFSKFTVYLLVKMKLLHIQQSGNYANNCNGYDT